jgi:branched-subunit amino acid transport protein
MTTWIALAVVAVGSYVLRFVPLVALDRFTPPPVVERALSYAGPSAMAALTVGALAHQDHVTGSTAAALAAGTSLVVATLLTLRGRPFLVAGGAALAAFAVLDLMLA